MCKRIALISWWLPTIAWMSVIFYFSSLPEAMTPGRYIIPDYIAHAGEYFILAFFIFITLSRSTKLGFTTSFWITLAWVAIYGLSDEIHQLYVPTRHFQVGDLLSDVCGALAFYFLLWITRKTGHGDSRLYHLLTGKGK